MSHIITTNQAAIVPQARVPFSVRLATLADIPFMDSMQKQFGKQLGYFPTKQFEGYVEMGGVLIAVDGVGDAVGSGVGDPAYRSGRPIGYVISRDRYLKRDELGVIYQLCAAPGTQRKLVGASLIAEVFKRSAYGCKLYCCWSAQDIDANYFWESIGFVPIAFRAGSAKKSRVHIFWQRRIREGDVSTPYWFPSQTSSGAIREDRLVLPIPPGVSWKDVMPVVLPGAREGEAPAEPSSRESRKRLGGLRRAQSSRSLALPKQKRAGERPTVRRAMQFAPPSMTPLAQQGETESKSGRSEIEKVKRPKQKVKNDPALVAKARELRDRWMEQLNEAAPMLRQGKYDVARMLVAGSDVAPTKALPAAA